MAQTREKGGRVVFIGNIPYGVSEEQIMEIFGRVGNVVSFRLVHDKETGKPKGFGFLEYTDTDAAASAVRNLNSFQLQGRELKVDYSNDNSGKSNTQSDQQGSGRAPPPAHFNVNMSGAPQQQMNGMPSQGTNLLPPLPPGTELPPGLTAPDAISRTLSAMPADQLLDVLSQMKNLATQEPARATQLLQQAPQLSYAIFQALILLGLVDTSVLSQLLQQQQQQPQAQTQQHPSQPQQQPPMPGYPAYGQSPPQQQYAPPPHQQQPAYPAYGQPQGHPGYQPTPPQPQPAWQPPPQQAYQAPPPQSQLPPVQDQQQQQLMQQVLAMTREQIFALDELPRNQIIQLRAQMGHPVA